MTALRLTVNQAQGVVVEVVPAGPARYQLEHLAELQRVFFGRELKTENKKGKMIQNETRSHPAIDHRKGVKP